MNNETIASYDMNELIVKAMGARSMTEFAKACGVSAMSISRIKSGSKPSKKMCLKLSMEPYVKSLGLTSLDFLKAAGYTDEEEMESVYSYEQAISERLDTIAVGVVTKRLLKRNATYQIVPSTQNQEFNFRIQLNDEEVTCWEILLENEYQMQEKRMLRMSYYYLGRLLSLNPEKGKQYSMILNDKDEYDELLSRIDADMVKANVSVAYLNSKRMQVEKETHFGENKFISLTEDN